MKINNFRTTTAQETGSTCVELYLLNGVNRAEIVVSTYASPVMITLNNMRYGKQVSIDKYSAAGDKQYSLTIPSDAKRGRFINFGLRCQGAGY